MGEPARARPSFEELYERIRALPQGVTGEILEPGVLRTMSRPDRPHRWTARTMGQRLDAFDVRTGGTGWWIEVEVEIRFPLGRLAVPDVCGFRVERVPELPDENPLTLLPDWCCEILSPSTAREDRGTKLPLYATSGVGWTWLVDPDLRMVEVFETVQGRPTLALTAAAGERVILPPFDEEIDLAPWWAPRPAPAR
jgi:Uma2 family endonuclease